MSDTRPVYLGIERRRSQLSRPTSTRVRRTVRLTVGREEGSMPSGVLIVGGLVALIVGADVLVRAGSGLASWLGIRPMMIGLTVVSLGTSVPELAVGIDAAVGGSPGLAVGNIVGTNLVNLLLILGLSAVLLPIVLERATLRFDLPAMTAAAVLLYVLAIDGTLTRRDGIVLLL